MAEDVLSLDPNCAETERGEPARTAAEERKE
jgi:hypothetical protein